ncbi:MAG: hypothetical protein GY842_11780 [bacterium]|nr:hypothetical protein [bacterium]
MRTATMEEAAPTIMWVGTLPEAERAEWIRVFDEAPVDVVWADSVYVALARLGRKKVMPRAVLVWVDRLEPSEFEFFRLARQHGAPAELFACGGAGAGERLAQAVRSGAQDRLSAAQTAALLATITSRAERPTDETATEPAEQPESEPADELTDEPSQTAPPVAEVESAGNDRPTPVPISAPPTPSPVQDRPDEAKPPLTTDRPGCAAATERRQRIPVPWRRDADAPKRKPPARREGPSVPEGIPNSGVRAPQRVDPTGSGRAQPSRSSGERTPPSEPSTPLDPRRRPLEDDDTELFGGPLLTAEELELLMDEGHHPRQPGEGEEEAPA